jgi:hypothetical protein
MKITQNDLKRAYRDYLREQSPASTDPCIDEERWQDFLRDRLSRSSKGELIDHLTSCSKCAREFELLLEMKRSKNSLVAEIDSLLDSSQTPSESATVRPNPAQRLPFRWRFGLVFSGVAIFSLILSTLLFRHPQIPPIPDVTRGNPPIEIELQRPLNESTRKTGLEFQWKSRAPFDSYIIEIYDDSLLPVWQSPPLMKSRLSIPKEIFDSLENDKAYYWMVTGTLKINNITESRLGAFKLKK